MSNCVSNVPLVRSWFGLGLQLNRPRINPGDLPRVGPNQVLLIIGPSGSGKSCVLRQIVKDKMKLRHPLVLNKIRLEDRAVCDLFPGWDLSRVLQLLSRVGLAEAHTYVLRPRRLSEGQRFRLRLAIALARAQQEPTTLVCDEFATKLDPVTAAAVSSLLRAAVDRTPNLRALLATPRADLARAIRPDFCFRCDFGNVSW